MKLRGYLRGDYGDSRLDMTMAKICYRRFYSRYSRTLLMIYEN